MRPWVDVIARVHGLATHLLQPEQLAALARCADLAAVTALLQSFGYPVDPDDDAPAALELAARRVAAQRLRLLAWWCGTRTELLAFVFEDEDRRSLRALARGAAARTPAEQRLSGLIATPSLPERALTELAAQSSLPAVAALLLVWAHPYGPALVAPAGAAVPDLFRIELAINRVYAARAVKAVGQRQPLARWVHERIDDENALTAIALSAASSDITPRDTFLPGGASLGIDTFEEAVVARTGAVARLARVAGPAMAEALRRTGGAAERLDVALTHAWIEQLAAEQRREPLGPAAIIRYALAIRAEVMDVGRAIWGVALGAPAPVIAADQERH